MSEWKECKIADAPFEIIDGDRGTNYPKQDEFNQNRYCLFLNAKNVTTVGFAFNECHFISKEKDEKLRKGKLQRNDIVLTTRGTVGNIGFFNERIPYDNMRINSGMVIIRSDPKGILPEYTHQLFKFLKGDFDVFATGSAQPQLPIRDLKEISFFLPPLPEQRAIAGVLSSLDDKIDLLHRQNKTLEGMAEAFWRKMFVEVVETEWKVSKLGDFIKTTSGGTPSRSRPAYYENGNYKWVKSKELQGTFIIDTEEKITEEAINNSSAKLLPKNSLLLAMYGATVGEYGILTEQATCNQAVCALLPNEDYPYTFIYMFLKMNKEEIINHAVGSAQQNISQIVIQNFEVLQPNHAIIQFHKSVEGLFEKIKLNIFQIRTLSYIRDTLLPKLMSGDIRVNNE